MENKKVNPLTFIMNENLVGKEKLAIFVAY